VVVYDAITGGRLPISAIESQLKAVVGLAKKSPAQAPIPLLTSLHRDKWAKAHGHLLALSNVNRSSFHDIEQSLFCVCLDDHKVAPTWTAHAENVFHGPRGHNRWFDKCISLVVDNTARAGCNGEHSPLDAVVPAMMFDVAASREPASDPQNAVPLPALTPPVHLSWVTDAGTKSALEEAQRDADALISDSDVLVIHFTGYGTDWIKKVAKCSPDAFIQQSLQLAYFKIHGTVAPVYESASTRQFLHGRTETCRSLTSQQLSFVQAFTSPKATPSQKYDALQSACKAHTTYIAAATRAAGCDRHLLGLRLTLTPTDPTPEIFSDPAYALSQTFRLSTSGLVPSRNIMATGFGAVVPDGYGMNYIALGDMIKVGLECKKSGMGSKGGSTRYANVLQGVWEEMRKVCEEGASKAKL